MRRARALALALLAGCGTMPVVAADVPGVDWPEDDLEPRDEVVVLADAPRASLVSTYSGFVFETYHATWSRLDGPTCAFHPTCSAFTHEAVSRYGAYGVVLGFARLQRNHADSEFYPSRPDGRVSDPVSAHTFWFDPNARLSE